MEIDDSVGLTRVVNTPRTDRTALDSKPGETPGFATLVARTSTERSIELVIQSGAAASNNPPKTPKWAKKTLVAAARRSPDIRQKFTISKVATMVNTIRP